MDLQKKEGFKGNVVPSIPSIPSVPSVPLLVLIRAFDTKHIEKSYEIQQLIRIPSDELKQVQEWCKARHPMDMLEIHELKYLDMRCPLYKIQFNVCGDGMDETKSNELINFIIDRQQIHLWKMILDQKLKQETEESARLKRKQMIEDKRLKGEIAEIFECDYWQQLDMDSIFERLLVIDKKERPNERRVLVDDLIKYLRGMLPTLFGGLDSHTYLGGGHYDDDDIKVTRIGNVGGSGSGSATGNESGSESEIEIRSREEKVKPEPFRSTQIKETISFLGKLKTGDMIDHVCHRGRGLYYYHRNYLYKTTGNDDYFLPSCAFEMVLKHGLEYFSDADCGAEFVLVPNDVRVTYLDSDSSTMPFIVEISNTEGNKLGISLRDKVNREDYLTVNDRRFEASMIEFY